jgi:protein LSM14
MMMPRMGGGGYYPDRRAFNNGPIDGYYNYNSRDGQQRRQGGGNGRFDYELNGRMPRQPYRGSQQRLQQLKFEGDYDFEGANQQFKETLEKLSNVKINESSQENADGGDKENAEGEKKADESAAEEGEIKDEKFYDKTKSFFDAISCESVERSEAKPNDKAQRGVQRQKNQETFGQSAIRSYGYGGGYRRYGNRGGLMRNVPLRYRS